MSYVLTPSHSPSAPNRFIVCGKHDVDTVPRPRERTMLRAIEFVIFTTSLNWIDEKRGICGWFDLVRKSTILRLTAQVPIFT